jgi:phage-related protein
VSGAISARAALRLVGGIITTVWGVIGPTVLGIATGLFNGLVSIFRGIMNVVGGIWKTLAGILTGDWRKAGEGISQITRGLGDILRGIFTAIGSALVGIVRLLWAGITAVFQAGWNWVSGVFRGMWNGLITILRWPLDMGRAAIASAITQIRNVIMSLWSWASSVFRGAWNGMRSLLTDPISTAKRVLDGLIGGIKSGFSGMVNAIRDTMNRIRAWTAQPINFVINTVYNNGIRNFLNEILKMGGLTQLGPLRAISGYQSGGYVDLPWSASNRDPYLGVTPGGGAFRFDRRQVLI